MVFMQVRLLPLAQNSISMNEDEALCENLLRLLCSEDEANHELAVEINRSLGLLPEIAQLQPLVTDSGYVWRQARRILSRICQPRMSVLTEIGKQVPPPSDSWFYRDTSPEEFKATRLGTNAAYVLAMNAMRASGVRIRIEKDNLAYAINNHSPYVWSLLLEQ